MKTTALITIVFMMAGCQGTPSRYSELPNVDPNVMAFIVNDASDQLQKKYPAANANFQFDLKCGAFGHALEEKLRAQGYAVGDGGTPIRYSLDLYSANSPRLLLSIGDSQWTRLYNVENDVTKVGGAWAIWENEKNGQ